MPTQIFTPEPGGGSPDERGFLQMTSSGKASAQSAIDGLRASGSTNFRAGLAKALEYFKSARDTQASTYCDSVILFITDGRDTYIESGLVSKQA